MIRKISAFIAAMTIAGAWIGTASAAEVDVTLSPNLQEVVDSVNSTEQNREELFRRNRDDQLNPLRTERRLARSRFVDTRWAGEELIDNVNDFTVQNLLKALVNSNLEFAGLGDTTDRFRVELDRLKIKNYSVARVKGVSDYAVGRISRIDGNTGNVIESADITANLVIDFTSDYNYDGPDLAFADTDPDRRVGPTLAYFVKRGMEKLYPDTKFRGPVVVTFN